MSEPAISATGLTRRFGQIRALRGVDLRLENGERLAVVGVNGAGKTTSIAKLAYTLSRNDQKVIVAACDTFRAAAVPQLEIWAQRAGVDIVRSQQGADPAAVAFDAMAAAKATSDRIPSRESCTSS